MVNPTILLLIPLLPALGALINGTRAFARPLTPKNRAITNLVALGSTGFSALLALLALLAGACLAISAFALARESASCWLAR